MSLVQLYESTSFQWEYTGICGRVSVSRSKGFSFIRIHDEVSNSLCFELEVYEGFSYEHPLPFFLTFEGEQSVFGISFALEEDSYSFAQELDNAVQAQLSSRLSQLSSSTAPFGSQPDELEYNKKESFKQKPKKSVKHKISHLFRRKAKEEEIRVIGAPTSFKHHTHVGWNMKEGFTMENIPPEWKTIFVKAGVPKKALENPEIRRQILSIYEDVTSGNDECDLGSVTDPDSQDVNQSAPVIPTPPPLPQMPVQCTLSIPKKEERVNEQNMPQSSPNLTQIMISAIEDKFQNAIPSCEDDDWSDCEWSDD